MICLGAGLVALTLSAAPPDQTLVFYNARLALKDARSADTVKLWLLHNSLVDLTGRRGAYEEEFRSAVWAAMGNLGLCQDGFPRDTNAGAGLWPLALHNWLVNAATRGPPPDTQNPFDAFDVGRQQRFISIHDVLDAPELRSVSLMRSASCSLPGTVLTELGRPGSIDLTDRLQTGSLLRRLLVLSLTTLVREKVQSVAAVEARIFDLDLILVKLRLQRARQEGFAAQERARTAGISAVGAQEDRARAEAWPPSSPQAAFLRRALTWKASEWLSLSPERRLFLIAQARPLAADPAVLDRLVFSIIDPLIDRKEGAELESWVGFLDGAGAPGRRSALIAGDRGKRLLELEPASGFHERAVVALHRGVAFLEAGALYEALSSFAYAMAKSEESSEAAVCLALARRWLSYVLSHYQTNDEVIATLKALVPRQEYNSVIEDLVWRAALRADLPSFERVVASARNGGAFDARAARLRLLARGDPGALATELRAASADEPYFTLRFLRQLYERIEAEDATVRKANVPMLKLSIQVLDSIGGAAGKNNAQTRAAGELIARAQAVLEGLSSFDTSPAGKARGLAPGHEAFAGNIRLAPADPLPWPFRVPEPEQSSAFLPLVLQPVEWRDPHGELVFGWRLTE